MEKNQLEKKSIDQSERMSVRDVAAYFNQTTGAVYRWVRQGKLPVQRTPTGRISFVPRSAVEAYQVG